MKKRLIQWMWMRYHKYLWCTKFYLWNPFTYYVNRFFDKVDTFFDNADYVIREWVRKQLTGKD